jgi:hypothetical protein
LPEDEGILAESRYVFFDYAGRGYVGAPPDPVGTVLDVRTGRRAPVSLQPGCPPETFMGGPWLVFSCYTQQAGNYLELYGLASGRWRTVPIDQGASAVAAGRYWLELVSCPGGEHCLQMRGFQNIQTGEVRADPTSSTTFTDLNSSGLTRKICKPLHVPTVSADYERANNYQDISFFGPYAVSYPFGTRQGWGGGYVQRCGSHSQRPGGAIANSHLVVLPSQSAGNCIRPEPPAPACPRTLDGVFLANGARFTIPIPAAATYQTYHVGNVALSDRTLFLGTYDDGVCTGLFGPCKVYSIWTATIPSKPPARRR